VSDMRAPAEPQNTLAYRGAKYAVIVLSALIILALVGLVVGSILKLSGRASSPVGRQPATLWLPSGAKIISSESQPGRLILHIRSGAGDEIDILDTDDGKVVGQVKIMPPSPSVGR